MALRKTSKTSKSAQPKPDGQIRQSQLVTTFGTGAMVDLVDRAVVIGGLEHWHWGDTVVEALDDPRLRASLIPRLKSLSPDLDLATEHYFRKAPESDSQDPQRTVGVNALEFPRWFVCQGCRRLGRGFTDFEVNKKKTGYMHQCKPNKTSRVIPVRFVAACARGHLSDFPWKAFAHQESDAECSAPQLSLEEGATGDLGKIRVRCQCGAS